MSVASREGKWPKERDVDINKQANGDGTEEATRGQGLVYCKSSKQCKAKLSPCVGMVRAVGTRALVMGLPPPSQFSCSCLVLLGLGHRPVQNNLQHSDLEGLWKTQK